MPLTSSLFKDIRTEIGKYIQKTKPELSKNGVAIATITDAYTSLVNDTNTRTKGLHFSQLSTSKINIDFLNAAIETYMSRMKENISKSRIRFETEKRGEVDCQLDKQQRSRSIFSTEKTSSIETDAPDQTIRAFSING